MVLRKIKKRVHIVERALFSFRGLFPKLQRSWKQFYFYYSKANSLEAQTLVV